MSWRPEGLYEAFLKYMKESPVEHDSETDYNAGADSMLEALRKEGKNFKHGLLYHMGDVYSNGRKGVVVFIPDDK